jgi:hypothetical protein
MNYNAGVVDVNSKYVGLAPGDGEMMIVMPNPCFYLPVENYYG